MQSLTNEKKELTSIFLLVHHDSPSAFSYLSIHSFIHAFVHHFPPFFPQFAHFDFIDPCFPTFIRHLQALFVRRFFSCSCQLRSRWKVTRLTPDSSFMSCSRLIHKLLNLTTVHAVNPAATHAVCFFFPSALKSFNSSFPHTRPAQAVYYINWLADFTTPWFNTSPSCLNWRLFKSQTSQEY